MLRYYCGLVYHFKLKNTKFFTAEGTSKKDAEQNAASLCFEDVFKK